MPRTRWQALWGQSLNWDHHTLVQTCWKHLISTCQQSLWSGSQIPRSRGPEQPCSTWGNFESGIRTRTAVFLRRRTVSTEKRCGPWLIIWSRQAARSLRREDPSWGQGVRQGYWAESWVRTLTETALEKRSDWSWSLCACLWDPRRHSKSY